MPIYKIIPTVSFEGIPFGMEKIGVRKRIAKNLNLSHFEFQKGKDDNNVDAYDDFHVFYDDDDKFEAIEFFGKASVILEGEKVYPGDVVRLQNIISDLSEIMGSWLSVEQSIGVYAPQGTIESILFGKANYYMQVE